MNTNADKMAWVLKTPSYKTTTIYEYNHCIADINYQLLVASKEGDLHTVKYLINNKADIHYDNEFAIQMACQHGHLKVAKYLYGKGANIHV